MKSGFKRLSVLLGFVGFVIGFLWGAVSLEAEWKGALLLGGILGVTGAVGALLLGWTAAGFSGKE